MRRLQASLIRLTAVSLVAILGIMACFVSLDMQSNRLNVILVTLDTMRADRVGCYGYSSGQTPAIDGFAKSGALFEFARTPYPLTLPAHASILTGLNPPEHGLQVNGRGRLNDDIPVLAEILQKANYDTGAFIGAYVLDSKFGLDRGFQTYDDDLAASAPQQPTSNKQRDGKVVLDLALDWLLKRKSRPFFCWIHLYDPHGPYLPRSDLFGAAFEKRPYDAGVAYADLQLARLRKFLSEGKLGARTLVVVVGDHGEGLMEHNEPDHGYQLYETTLRVPLIFAGRSFIKPDTRISTPVSLIDLMPTILDCLNVPLAKPVSGRSVKPALEGQMIPTMPCYSETELAFLESRCSPLRSVTTERWKFIETARAELYDLLADPNESLNLAESEPDQVQEMKNLLEQICEKMTPVTAESVNLSPDEKQILASLGYVTGASSSKPPAREDRLPDVKEMLPHYVRLSEARELVNQGKVSDASDMIRRILQDAPGYSTARLLLGDLLMRQNQFGLAMLEYKTVVREQPDNAEAHAGWGNSLAAQGLFDDSIEHYHRAIEIDPGAAPYYYYLSVAFIRLGKPIEAMQGLENAVKFNPALVEARLQLSKLLAENGRVNDSRKQYEAALKYRPALRPPPWLPNH